MEQERSWTISVHAEKGKAMNDTVEEKMNIPKFATGGVIPTKGIKLFFDIPEEIRPLSDDLDIGGRIAVVVRCKHCKYYDNGECTKLSEPKQIREYERWIVDVDENDFCSYGERKGND